MGLTHYSIIKSIINNVNFHVVEPNFMLRKILSNNLDCKFYKDDTKINQTFDLTLITTPPFIHLKILNKCLERCDKKIFIEKPFGGHSNFQTNPLFESNNIFVG